MTKQALQVEAGEEGLRVDRWLSRRHPGISRRALGLLFASGQVRVNGRPAKKGDRVFADDRVEFDPAEAEVVARLAQTEDVRLALVTPDLVIMDKPAGVPSTAVPGKLEGTAAGQLLALFPELSGVGYGPREPGLVHRLDTQTSGLLLAARTPEAFAQLRQQMREGAIEKRYLAIANGTAPSEGAIDLGLESDPHDSRRVRTTGEGNGQRITRFRRLELKRDHSLLEVTLARGYRHQIRAHLASIGLPLVGDVLYGGPPAGLAPRHALHASYLANERGLLSFRANAELPDDLAAFWSALDEPDA